MIKNFVPRLYQQTILATSMEKNTLVVLPTGMGKTNIFLMLAAQRLKQFPATKILLIGPTKPLVDQYFAVFKDHFNIDEKKMAIFTGLVKPEKRAELWKNCQIIFSTPQGLENDIITNKISLEEVSLLGIDEAHRGVGNYAYVWIARQYQKKAKWPRILALTASPGSELQKIQDICKNLYIEEIEVRTPNDPDVRPYVQDVKLSIVKVELPLVFKEIKNFLSLFLRDRLQKLKKWGILQRANISYINKKDLLKLQAQLRARISSGDHDFVLWNAISLLAEIMKIYHALELLETQGVVSLHNYLEKLKKESATTKVKAVKNMVKDINFKSALIKTQKLFDEQTEHPKLVELQHIIEKEIKKDSNMKAIVFNQYRDNAIDIVEKLNKIKGIRAKLFVGQAKKGNTGYSQKEQKTVLNSFRNNEVNILVSTSVGEEGLDIIAVNTVIFYEPVPSVIRTIQRKGRTGRLEKGKIIILVAKGTRDESYSWSAYYKEKKMYRNLENIRNKLQFEKPRTTLERFIPNKEKIKIFADYREKGSGILKELVELGVDLKIEKLITDYILSSRCGVECKNVNDFVNSIIDGRLLQQIKELKKNFARPLVIIEGTDDVYSVRNIHANAIKGALATIAVSYGIPILHSRNSKETASFLHIIAKREQEQIGKDFSLHGDKKPLTLKEQQEYIVSALPGIGATLAKPLLKKFKTVKKIFNAKQEQLEKIEKIGPKKAQAIKGVVESKYVT